MDTRNEWSSTHGDWASGSGYRQEHEADFYYKPETSDTGGDSNGNTVAHENLPPYYALCYIIKHSSTGNISVSAGDKIEEGNTKAEVVDTNGDGHFFVVTEGTERLRVTPHGFVGIGTTTPAGVLDINSSTGDANVYIKTLSNNLGNTQILFGDSDRNDSGKVQYNHPGDYMVFHTNSSEQVRITSNGSVGIGTTNPVGSYPGTTNTLHLDGTTASLRVGPHYSDRDRDHILLQTHGTDSYIRSNNERFHIYNDSGDIVLHGASDAENVRITGIGSVGIGTTNPTTKLHVNGTVAIGSSIYDSNGNLGSDGQVLSVFLV